MLIILTVDVAAGYSGEIDESNTSYDKDKGERFVKGIKVRFNVPEDRKIERIGKAYIMEGMDKYFGRKIEEINKTQEEMSKKLTDIKTELSNMNTRMEKLESTLATSPIKTSDGETHE